MAHTKTALTISPEVLADQSASGSELPGVYKRVGMVRASADGLTIFDVNGEIYVLRTTSPITNETNPSIRRKIMSMTGFGRDSRSNIALPNDVDGDGFPDDAGYRTETGDKIAPRNQRLLNSFSNRKDRLVKAVISSTLIVGAVAMALVAFRGGGEDQQQSDAIEYENQELDPSVLNEINALEHTIPIRIDGVETLSLLCTVETVDVMQALKADDQAELFYQNNLDASDAVGQATKANSVEVSQRLRAQISNNTPAELLEPLPSFATGGILKAQLPDRDFVCVVSAD